VFHCGETPAPDVARDPQISHSVLAARRLETGASLEETR